MYSKGSVISEDLSLTEIYEKQIEKTQKILSSDQSTESEGPIIVINDTSTGSDSESTTESQFTEDITRKLQLTSFSGCDSIQSSGTELTSEGGESEVERRPLTPSSTEILTNFLENIFSDEGLSKDLFLLKHVRRHQHGFVSLKLLAGFKEAKKLNCDWHALSMAARQSSVLEVNFDGRKVRRKAPLPEKLIHVPSSRVVAVVNLTEDLLKLEKLASTFSTYGNIASLHLIKHKPGSGIPEELQSLAARVPEVAHTNCALVQYEDVWGVAKAIKEFTSSQTSLHVYYNRKRSTRSVTPTKSPRHYCRHSPQHNKPKRKDSHEKGWRKRILYQTARDSTGSEPDEFEAKRIARLNERKPRGSLPNIKTNQQRFNDSFSLPNSPQLTRKVLKGITRNPKGPDGTVGFHRS